MTDYLYNAEGALNPSKSERTFQLLLSPDHIEVSPGKLYDSRIWVIVKIGGEYFLYAKQYPISVESIETDIGEGKLILNADVMKSAYFLSSSEPAKNRKYIISDSVTNVSSMKLSELSSSESEMFEGVEDRAQQYLFSTPTSSFLRQEELPEITPRSNIDLLVRAIVDIAKHNLSVADLARDARNRTWDEYHCLASRYLLQSKCFDENDIQKAVDNSQNRLLNYLPERLPVVNTDLRLIDPENITIRTFVSPEKDTFNTMVATEKAEQTHQAILRDVSKYLLARDITPLESSSVDLAIKLSAGLILFEIKSSNADNFSRQCESALTQILKYDYEFCKSNIRISGKFLIVERSVGDVEEEYMTGFFNYCGVGVLYYDRTKTWPGRLSGIEDTLC